MSNSGICAEDATLRATANLIGLTTKTGPFHKVWKRGLLRAGGVVILDDGTMVLDEDVRNV